MHCLVTILFSASTIISRLVSRMLLLLEILPEATCIVLSLVEPVHILMTQSLLCHIMHYIVIGGFVSVHTIYYIGIGNLW